MLQEKISKNKNYSGFSFIEGILAVFIISTGMIAVLSLMSGSLRESMDSRDQIVAVFLSQEGAELVRNLRDNNWAGEIETFSSTNFPANNDLDCSINSDSNAIDVSPSDYNIVGMSNKFQRKIQVNYDDDAKKNTAEITSIVVWGADGFSEINNNDISGTCNSGTKCTYTQTTLTRWGGN